MHELERFSRCRATPARLVPRSIRFFRGLTVKRIQRDAFPSFEALIAVNENYMDGHNPDPKPSYGPRQRERFGRKSSARCTFDPNSLIRCTR